MSHKPVDKRRGIPRCPGRQKSPRSGRLRQTSCSRCCVDSLLNLALVTRWPKSRIEQTSCPTRRGADIHRSMRGGLSKDLEFRWQQHSPRAFQHRYVERTAGWGDPPQSPTWVSVGNASHKELPEPSTHWQFDRNRSLDGLRVERHSHTIQENTLHSLSIRQAQRHAGPTVVLNLKERLVFSEPRDVAPAGGRFTPSPRSRIVVGKQTAGNQFGCWH